MCTLAIGATGWLLKFPFLFQTSPVVVTPIAVLSGTVPSASALSRGGFQFSTFTN